MVKKSVSKAVNNVSKQLKSVFDTQNILSSTIVILLVIYMSFVNRSNVPRLFNNVIVKLVLFGLVAYTFFQDKLVAVFLAITVILSISLASKSKNTESNSSVTFDEDEETMIPSQEVAFQDPLPSVEAPYISEESGEPLSSDLSVSSINNPIRYLNTGPTGVPSNGLSISTHSRV